MKIFLGADHGGYSYKEVIKKWLEDQKHQVVDVGAHQLDSLDDYPVFAFEAAKQVSLNNDSLGILFCRSGAGMTIAANKVKNVRAVEVINPLGAEHAKQHNNANIIALSADWLDLEAVKKIISTFLNTPFTNEERHLRRINQITEFENSHNN